MPKIIIVFFIFTIGMVVWALQPAPEKTLETRAVETPQASPASSTPDDSSPIKRRIAKKRVKAAPKKAVVERRPPFPGARMTNWYESGQTSRR